MAVNFTYEISLVMLNIDVTKRHVEIITGKINSCFQKNNKGYICLSCYNIILCVSIL
jgi:hypothetical protein